jgi:hypothetical protein
MLFRVSRLGRQAQPRPWIDDGQRIPVQIDQADYGGRQIGEGGHRSHGQHPLYGRGRPRKAMRPDAPDDKQLRSQVGRIGAGDVERKPSLSGTSSPVMKSCH